MFQLTNANGTFDFDISGAVQQAGNPVGTWSTDNNNQIVVTLTAGGTQNFVVGWQFNQNNQLTIVVNGNVVFNFHAGAALPLYSNQKDLLVAQPDSQNPFTFQLRGTWTMDQNHNLVLTVGNLNLVLDGFLQDPEGQFSYHFFDLANPALGNENVLQFPGLWRHTVVDGKPVLAFDYEKESGGTSTFDLPATINLDPSINEFVYEYDKNNQTLRLQFVGILHISSDFTITYKLSRDTSSAGGDSTTFTMDAVYNKQDFNGNLELSLKKDDGTAGTTSLTVGGNFTAVIGQSKLSVGFSFTQSASGNAQTVGFNGDFTSATGDDISWTFQSNATTMSVSLAAHVHIGPSQLDARFNLTCQNGKVVGIHALFGIQF